jgi:hypothetical protein
MLLFIAEWIDGFFKLNINDLIIPEMVITTLLVLE